MLTAACAQASELRRERVPSPTLGRDIPYTVYLPDGFGEPGRRFPLLYLLHGAGADEQEWATQGQVQATLDGLTRRGLLRPMVAVMPSLGPHSWYLDGAVDAAATAFLRDLMPQVEARHQAQGERGARLIAGQSMGGHGSLNLALRQPQLFCGAALISPAVYDPLPPAESAARTSPQFQRQGRFDDALWRERNFPAALAAYQAAPQKVAMWIGSGDHDALGIAPLAATLFWRLRQIQPQQVALRIVDGEHDWRVFREALPEALAWIERQCTR